MEAERPASRDGLLDWALPVLCEMRNNRTGAQGHTQRAERRALDVAIAALRAEQDAGMGWRVVPTEPTDRMLYEARHCLNHNGARERLVVAPDEQVEKMRLRWGAMLRAVPPYRGVR